MKEGEVSFDMCDWLQERCSVEEVEAWHTGESGKPFNHQYDRWQELKGMMASGDELWAFCSPAESWRMCAGRQGYAVVRGGQIIGTIITMMN